MSNRLRREPPAAVRRELAAEVGFGCPVEGCGSPYLTWHHFDPPWNERQHHEPTGMIALCREHHGKADVGAFTAEQFRELKRVGRDRAQLLQGRFDWMRKDLLAVIGGNFYLRTPTALRVQNVPVVWFNRDEQDRLLVNLQALTTSGEPRMVMVDNFWITEGTDEAEIICPPSGRLVEAKYPNGDRLRVEFREIKTEQEFDERYPSPAMPETPDEMKAMLEEAGIPEPERSSPTAQFEIAFPLTVVEITMKIAGLPIDFGPKGTTLGGSSASGNWMADCPVGMQIGDPGE